MEKIFARASEGAGLGFVIGGAIGTILAAGTAVVFPPASLLVLGATAAASMTTAEAVGTLVGGSVGATAGSIETINDRKKENR